MEDKDSWQRRRYNILTLRYVNGLSPDEVADRLAVSRRHFYRQLQRALDELAAFLWAGVVAEPWNIGRDEDSQEPPESREPDNLELLLQESAALRQEGQCSMLDAVLQNVLDILAPVLKRRALQVSCDVSSDLPEVSLSPEILKQLLLGLFGDLLKGKRTAAIILSASVASQGVNLTITPRRHPQLGDAVEDEREDLCSKTYMVLAMLQGLKLEVVEGRPDGLIYQMVLPVVGQRTVLVVDDNEDVCLLFRRYLASGGYQALIARNAAEAIQLARSRELRAVTLDLMMNNEDGWDILQMLRHDPHTARLPIIVCTVLDQEELATMLGATTFLKKPVMREPLLKALAEIKTRSSWRAAEP
jgi:CheY-like chemotaxis protein/AraC-like DNA-binding protein